MGVNKYLIFDSIDVNKELLQKYNDVFNGIMSKIKEIDNDECYYEKDYMKIKFNSDDELPLNKPLSKPSQVWEATVECRWHGKVAWKLNEPIKWKTTTTTKWTKISEGSPKQVPAPKVLIILWLLTIIYGNFMIILWLLVIIDDYL